MTELNITPLLHLEQEQPSAEAIEAGVAQTEAFLRDVAPHLGRLFGMDLNIKVGKGWSTSLEPGSNEVTADPRFFIEKGFTPEMSNYATLHEVAAHLREKVTEPRLTDRVLEFIKPVDSEHPNTPLAERKVDPKRSIFHNILSDIAGNNLIHAVLPRMRTVAKQLYEEKLFAETDYQAIPRHLQFLYKIIRDEMIPDSQTVVLPEVDTAIEGLRNYQGKGDVITYGTSVAKSAREAMPASERFAIWTRIIHPIYEELLEQDRQDPTRQDQPGESSDGQSGEGQDSFGKQGENSGDGQKSDDERFGSYYRDYQENRHPEPMDDGEQDKLHDHAKEVERSKREPSPPSPKTEHERQMDEKVRAATGHSLHEQRRYDGEIIKWQSSITEMRSVFQRVINERVALKRGLSRRTFSEGAVLDPDRLVQTVIDVRNNIEEPEAFRDYETRRGEAQAIGRTDYVFMLDVSGSMGKGEKAQAAAASTIIGLEGLAALQRDIEAAEAAHKVDLDLDIRTAIYTFGDESKCLKPLSTKVTPKERLDAYSAVLNPESSSTQDYLALEEIEQLPHDSDRRRILIAVSDGGSTDGYQNTSARARRAIDRLRGQGWFVYGISIGSDEAEQLYRPTARRVDDPSKLPGTIGNFIEATIS